MECAETLDALAKKLGPLSFDSELGDSSYSECILCSNNFNLNEELPVFLKHLFEEHYVVVEDIQNISSLPEYINFWKQKFKNKNIGEIVPAVKIDSTSKAYFVISTLLNDDKEVRHMLKLKHILQIQEFERNDSNYVRPCLFCKLNFEGSRSDFISHLSMQHNLQLGNPQNLVYIDEFINLIESKFKLLKCIYCEKIFPDRHTLKEHMRKKLHKRINPQSKEYDKFYIVNYLEVDKNWLDIDKESDRYATSRENEADSEEEYSDWKEDGDKIRCLFCDHVESTINAVCQHMIEAHNFNFEKLTEPFDFYQKLKLVNYIRRQFHNCKCFYCDESFDNKTELSCHFQEDQHFKLPDTVIFDQPEFYFPTFENDAFLYFIDDLGSNE